MKSRAGRGTVLLGMAFGLSACGGGGGGGGGTVPAFTSWSAIQPSSTVIAKGPSQEARLTYDPDTGQVTGVGLPSDVAANATATMTFDADGFMSKLVLTTPTTTVDLNIFADLGEGVIAAIDSLDPFLATSAAVIADPVFLGYEYQTFGVWEVLVSDTGTIAGTFSAGAPTPGSSIPATNTASFAGNLAGLYVDQGGDAYFAFGEVNVGVDFARRTLDFSTAFTFIKPDLDFAINNEIDRPDLNLSGNLSYAPGTNSFTGPVTTFSGLLNGDSTGQFYGPAAQELGGVFFLEGAGIETYGGAYGAVKQ